MSVFRLQRPGAPWDFQPTAAYGAVVPRLVLDDVVLPDVGRSATRFDVVDARTLVEPSRWERVYATSLAERLGARVEWSAGLESQHGISRSLASSAAWAPGEVPDGVALRRASTRRGEARVVCREIRQWIEARGLFGDAAARACDDVLILVPGRPEVFALWHRELNFADIPTRSRHLEPIATHAIARWVIGLCELRQWASEPVPREHLRGLFEPRFWSQKAVVGEDGPALRKALRNLLITIRRDSFRYADWEAHVLRNAKPPEGDAVLTLSAALRDATADGPLQFARLLALLTRLEVRDAVHAAKDVTASAVVEKVFACVRDLAYEEAGAGGHHPDGARPAALLERRFRTTWIARGEQCLHGVRLVAYDSYDGGASELLFATGLGEGDFPVPPARWDAAEEAAARGLGLLAAHETVDDYVHDELERQIRLAAHAFDRCEGGVALSYATEGPGTEQRYPGAMLSLLVGGWSEADWHGRQGVETFTWADEIPRQPGDAICWSDAGLFAGAASFRRWLRELDDDALSPDDYRRARALRENAEHLGPSQEAFRERHPRLDEEPRFGAFAGMLPGAAAAPDAFSASALEAYGQCGTKYFFSKLLRVSDTLDLSESLEATETGTIIHNAFAEAAQEVIDLTNDRLWSMCIEPDESREEATDRVLAVVDRHLDRTVRTFLAEQASMSEQLVDAVVRRWSGAFRLWIQTHLVDRLPASPTHEQLGEHPDVVKRRKAVRDHEEALAMVAALRQAIERGEVTSKSAAGKFGSTAGNGAIKVADLHTVFEDGGRGTEERLVGGLNAAREECAAEEEKVRATWSRHFNRDVVHAELAFGMERGDSDRHSSPDPVTVHIDDLAIRVRGQIDRIDWDRDRHQLAVRDFKTGRRKAASTLKKEMAAGRHLQLPLYAMAIEELARAGALPHLSGAQTVEVSLEHPRDPPTDRRHATEVRLDGPSGYAVDTRPARWGELTRTWLGWHVRNIRNGNFPLLPGACPIENTGYCDFARCCGYTSEFGRRADEPRPRMPQVAPLEVKAPKLKYPCPAVLAPICTTAEVTEAAVRADHDAAARAAADIDRDVAIAAGAGTGKTYNLVLRYLAALAGGAPVQQILCITFTRRAAAEMKSRIREALLSEPQGPQAPFVEALRADQTAFRRLLLALSAAPITTIDSLAGSVFREAQGWRARRSGQARPALDVVTDNDVADQLRTFVRQSFLAGLEAGDPHLGYLARELDPIAARELLLEACRRDVSEELAGLATLDERVQAIESGWYRIMQPTARDLFTRIAHWPLEEFEELLAAGGSGGPSEEGAAFIRKFLATMSRGPSDDPHAQWLLLRELLTGPINQTRFGKGGLAARYKECRALLKEQMQARDPERWNAAIQWVKALDDTGEFARTAAHASFVAQRWAEGFRQYLVSLGRVRFSDVEVLASRALGDPETVAALAPRFAYRHIFLDEAQDTSYSQIHLIDAVRRMAEQGTGAPCREFVVGDVKQSIYAFRGAEVDVFTRRVEQGAKRFTVNRRSTPSLLRAFNSLFDALFGASDAEGSLDPRAEVPFEPLAWPAERRDPDDAAIELFAVPGASWFPVEVADDETPEEPPEAADEVFRATPLQRGLGRRIAELVQKYPPGNHGASIAILVGSWRRADFYRDLLEAYDIPAAVQGGRGLLNSPEVDALVQWLEAVAYPNRHIAFLGALRGPGIALSDAALYALRMGHGVSGLSGVPPFAVKASVAYGEFSAEDAVRAWYAEDAELDTEATFYLLRRDAELLHKFRQIWDRLPGRLGIEAPSETIAWLADTLGLWSFWHAREGGRQAVANIRTFLDLVRDLEGTIGQDPWGILRRLTEMRDNSDPAAGGLDASGGAPVVITTYWQAKGLEWPVVVLPDVDKTAVRAQTRGLGDNRICLVDDGLAAVHTTEVRQSKPEKPMDSSVTAVTDVLNQYRAPAQRAELRRLLYVAMTRAKEKLVLSGTFDAPTELDPDAQTVTTLHGAKDWATTLRICLGLIYDAEARAMTTGAASAWAELEAAGQVRVIDGALYGEGFAQARTAATAPPLPEAGCARHWRVIPAHRLALLRPSDLVVDSLPQPDPALSTPLPAEQVKRVTPFANDADQGTAFHALMEALAFGDADGEALAATVLAEQRLDLPREAVPARLGALMELCRNALGSPIAAELRDAAARGELYHELPLRFVRDDRYDVFGVIDLVWRDRAGRTHVLDYKTGFRYPTTSDPTNEQLRHHYAQTKLYAEGLRRCGHDVASFGIWYVAAPAILRWP